MLQLEWVLTFGTLQEALCDFVKTVPFSISLSTDHCSPEDYKSVGKHPQNIKQ